MCSNRLRQSRNLALCPDTGLGHDFHSFLESEISCFSLNESKLPESRKGLRRAMGGRMLSKCANPHCRASFLYLHQGKLFRIETAAGHHKNPGPDPDARKPVRRLEYF